MKYTNQIILLFVSVLFFEACSPKDDLTREKHLVYSCDLEQFDSTGKKYLDGNGQAFFGNPETRSDEVAFWGTHSAKLTSKNPYALTAEIGSVAPDDYLELTIWRKSSDGKGVIVLDGGEGFYYAGNEVVEEHNGWQKILAEYHVPPNFYGAKFKVYVWNNGPNEVYFDDFKIVQRARKIYPEYTRVKSLLLYADQADLDRLGKKRLTAFESEVLVNSEEDYSNLVLFDGNEFLNASFRLKGDLLDHLQGEKWSFRIKLKKGFAWDHLRTFSVQSPLTRNFVHEWLAHRVFDSEDVLTTRYGFIPLRMNDRSLGIYAWEEHFEKQLVESRNRREGPILRFDESIFWQRVLENNRGAEGIDIDYFNASPIIPFKEGQVVGDSLKLLQMEEAQKLLTQYRNRSLPVSEIFDVKKLARYFALIDLTQFYHGFTWHNQRFYFNPVTCLLEPIAFDGYIEDGIFKRFDEPVSGMVDPAKVAAFHKEELMLFQPFADSLFAALYLNDLEKYSSAAFIESVKSSFQTEADSLSAEIKKEFPYYRFDFAYLENQAAWIRSNLEKIGKNMAELGNAVRGIDPQKFKRNYTTETNSALIPMLVHAYYNRQKSEVKVLNFHNNKVKILGAFLSDRLPDSFEPSTELEPFDGLTADRAEVAVSSEPLKILVSVENNMYEVPVYNWKYDEGFTTRQNLLKSTANELPLVNGKVILEGENTFTTDVVVPPNATEVVIRPGARIDLVQGAGFFSFVPLNIEGTVDLPVTILSSDHTSNGFNVIQPGGKSSLKYVHFSGLSSIRKQGWQTPAAVTFYEADVEMENCIFGSNINCDDALNVVRSDFFVQNCRFENTFADAFDSDFCTGTVKNCVFENPGNDAIDFSGSRIFISGCKMINVADKAISGGEHSYLTVSDCQIDGANIGIASKDLSELKLSRITMENTFYGMLAFVKKPEYGPASIEIDDLKMKNYTVFHQIEEGSVLRLNGKLIPGREKKLAEKLYQ